MNGQSIIYQFCISLEGKVFKFHQLPYTFYLQRDMPYAQLLIECSNLEMHHMTQKILASEDYVDLLLIGIEKEQRIMVQIVLDK